MTLALVDQACADDSAPKQKQPLCRRFHGSRSVQGSPGWHMLLSYILPLRLGPAVQLQQGPAEVLARCWRTDLRPCVRGAASSWLFEQESVPVSLSVASVSVCGSVPACLSVSVCVCERERECVCVFVCVRERLKMDRDGERKRRQTRVKCERKVSKLMST